ncbi:hypothetical protein [Streptomyces sp. NPDC058877]|uniref:hypothetical protein n=1 Tax=unclassified Streptomyces TaxID=2593676 RepID=UPI0036A9D99C
MASTTRTWYVPYDDSCTSHKVHDPIPAPTNPDEHSALMVHLYDACHSFVTVHCITETEALALGTEAITQRQQPADTSYLQGHPLAQLPFAQTAARIFCADVEVHYQALDGVYDFIARAYRHRSYEQARPSNISTFTESFDTRTLVGLYQQYWLVVTGRPHQSLTPLSRAIGDLPS